MNIIGLAINHHFQTFQNGATTFSITTFNIMILGVECCYPKCRVIVVILSVLVLPSGILLC
jgi:hypothetical protein